MIPRDEPIRKCIACGRQAKKDEFLMIVRPPKSSDDKEVKLLEGKRKKSGRGYYICKDMSCIKKAKKSRRLERLFSKNFNINFEDIYGELESAVSGSE